MAAPVTRRRHAAPKEHSALVLTFVGAALFALGMIHLISEDASVPNGHAFCSLCQTAEESSSGAALAAFKLGAWFATAGWLLEQYKLRQVPVDRWVRRWYLRLQAFCRIPADGILEMLVGGLLFIILLLLGMVGLWSGTVR